MSRIGKKPIPIPLGVTVTIDQGGIEVQGPKGKLRQGFPPGVTFEVQDGQILAKTVRDDKELGKFHGLGRSLVANAVSGVTNGFKRELDIVGIGYRGEVKGRQVVFALGYSHAVVFDIPTSKLKVEIARILQDEGYVQSFKIVEEKAPGKGASRIRLVLKYGPHGERVITGIQRISRPGRRVYFGRHNVPSVLGGLGTSILTTSRGVMTGREAAKVGVGGELLCNIW